VSPEEKAAMYDLLRRFAPFAKGHPLGSSVCLYTNTPDGHFIVDRLPRQPQTVVLSACSGHGFKFSIVLGEIVADLLQGQAPAFDLRPFALSRFSS
jgi:sarcosine oxidase